CNSLGILLDMLRWFFLAVGVVWAVDIGDTTQPPKSGIGIWVDVDTPDDKQTMVSSRGDTWHLVMSDEFEIPNRNFTAGEDHLWMSLDIPDGVNRAIEYYTPNNSYTKDGYFWIQVDSKEVDVQFYNVWADVPGWTKKKMWYTASMMQSWNKFCIQGGFIEIAAKLPGATNKESMNPHVTKKHWNGQMDVPVKPSDKIPDIRYYPTWPGLWMMGNLGRALFAASTNRMWPWTYDECDERYRTNQRISACNPNPGFGLNPNQGRGSPEIDILEGGGTAISSSIQIAPGMPDEYRLTKPLLKYENSSNVDPQGRHGVGHVFCYYEKTCLTPGANIADVTTAAFASRGHKSWYHGLRYAANDRCTPDPKLVQQYESVAAAVNTTIVDNQWDIKKISSGRDFHADLSLIDGKGPLHWGINYKGTCFPIANGYKGGFLCDRDSTNPNCDNPRTALQAPTNMMEPFEYQMDAISSNWDINYEAYTTFYKYQLEWVIGPSGYVRWMLDKAPIFEIPAATLTNPPQGGKESNPRKIMIEEPSYIIFNVAMSSAWGATPPNYEVGPCRGNATIPKPGTWEYNATQNICDSFPMYMVIDYIRVWQDNTTMSVGCDPPSHPTKQFIKAHILNYTDPLNPDIQVAGGATCRTDDDCTTSTAITGACVNRRCKCTGVWTGPRCTKYDLDDRSFGPPIYITMGLVAFGGLSAGLSLMFHPSPLCNSLGILLDMLRWFFLAVGVVWAVDIGDTTQPPKSGIGIWVDVDTPDDKQTMVSSRGDTWHLVMSDEFEIPNRNFTAGEDHLWMSLDIPDGVNRAIEYYTPNNSYTKDGYFWIQVDSKEVDVQFYNVWADVPGWTKKKMWYTASMMQSWNKFCIQGGFIEIAAKLPGATNKESMNPHVTKKHWNGQMDVPVKPSDKIPDIRYYPTWPGLWMMGNLGRALFAASTNRMWPWTYDECDERYRTNQRISACNPNPGFGLNPNQGRGSPEIDILEGGGTAISSSIQIAPGMPDEYRLTKPLLKYENSSNVDPQGRHGVGHVFCYYEKTCLTPGANIADVTTAAFASRGHKSWYHGLRYAANDRCTPDPKLVQQYESVAAAVNTTIVDNQWDIKKISSGRDFHADLSLIDGKGPLHWGINYKGTCFPIANGYKGGFLCDRDSTNPNCDNPRTALQAPTNMMEPFEYQMDAISSNWDINYEAYTTFYKYQLEWVIGPSGYVRWMLDKAPIFEIPAATLTNPPQGGKESNPRKIMIEEPSYIIFNVAMSSAWGATPPNYEVGPCRGNATIPKPGTWEYNATQNICDSFPMYMVIDYIRVWQDNTTMSVGCDPPSHPTKQFIKAHILNYTDPLNPDIQVAGGATCRTDDDCTTSTAITGACVNRRCKCTGVWTGPRCTKYDLDDRSFGPPIYITMGLVAFGGLSAGLSLMFRTETADIQEMRRATTVVVMPPQQPDSEIIIMGE
ncbi:beta-glucan synthesis-associated protein, partial [Thraustotheca clavata]